MATYRYNPYKGEERLKKLYDFEESRSLNENLEKTLKKIGKNISDSISESNCELIGKLDDDFDKITDVLGIGFSDISGKLDNVNSSIENLTLMFDWRLSEVINQQRISNLLLGNIVLLLRVPDFQKERQYYIEQGFKHYKNASLDEELYEDALKNLLEAEKRETTDYIVLNQIGMIYLHSKKEVTKDLIKAEDYFRRAAKYSVVESNPKAQKTLNILTGEFNQNISTTEAAKIFAANAYFRAGIACYQQDKFFEAAELCEKAYALSPSLLEAGFLQAKSLAVIDKIKQSVEILRDVIQTQPFIYTLKVAADTDFESKSEVQQLLIQLRDTAVHQASIKLKTIEKEIISNSNAKRFLPEIENLVKKNSYLGALNALDKLNKSRNWEGLNITLFEGTEMAMELKLVEITDASILEFVSFERNKYEKESSKLEFFRQIQEDRVKELKEQEMQEKQLMLRLEQDRKQINELILQAQIEERRNRNLAISLYEKAAKLGSYEAGQKLQMLKGKYPNQNAQEQVKELLLKAQTEEEIQNKKWLFKNYELAIYFYEEAAKLGSYEARQKLKELKKT